MSDATIQTSQEHARDVVHPDGAILLSHFEDLTQQNESTKLGMWTFLATEVMFFSGLFMAYILFRWKFYDGFAEASNLLNTKAGALNTGALLVSSLTMALAVDYAKTGITANLVLPGWIATAAQLPSEVAAGEATPIGRSASADEVASGVAYLATPGAADVTGTTLIIDGGNAIAGATPAA